MKRIFYKIIPKKNWQIEYADGESILIMLKICLPRIWPSSTLSKSIIRDSNDKCWKLSLSFTIFRNSWPRVKIKSFSESLVHKSWWIILIHLAWFFVFSVRFSCPTWSTSSCMFFFPSLAFYLSFFFHLSCFPLIVRSFRLLSSHDMGNVFWMSFSLWL